MRRERFWRPGAASHHSQVTMEDSWHESSFKKLFISFLILIFALFLVV